MTQLEKNIMEIFSAVEKITINICEAADTAELSAEQKEDADNPFYQRVGTADALRKKSVENEGLAKAELIGALNKLKIIIADAEKMLGIEKIKVDEAPQQ